MPEYLAPGVYMEEIEVGAQPIEGVGTSTAGFLGMTERGPAVPTLVTSYEQFRRRFGEPVEGSYMAHAVDGFFRNGGQRCYIARTVGRNSRAAAEKIQPLEFTALGEGEWGNRVAVKVSNKENPRDPSDKTRFSVLVGLIPAELAAGNVPASGADPSTGGATLQAKASGEVPSDTALADAAQKAGFAEFFDDLSVDPKSPDFVETRINARSNLVTVTCTPPASGEVARRPKEAPFVFLARGNDDELTVSAFEGGIGGDGVKTGLAGIGDVDEVAILYAPDLHCLAEEAERADLAGKLIDQCELLKDRFLILDSQKGQYEIDSLQAGIGQSPRDTKYAAIYFPWIQIMDPATRRLVSVPPGGHVAGVYARTDVERGVHKAPANAVLRGALDLDYSVSKGEQEILNPRGINCIRGFRGQGIRIWGARTVSSDSLWKYINVRRLFMFLEESIADGTRWAVFEPNDQRLWARIRQSVTEFLTRVWHDGALFGTTADQAFFVRCDQTTMTQDDIDNGRLIVLIGVAPVKPAEFVVFRIAQWRGGSAATEG